MQTGELRLLGGIAMVHTKETPREKMFAAFFRVWATDTDEGADAKFEALAAAAERAAEGYFLSRGWKKPEKRPAPVALALFSPAE